jgi:hypothetical protein
MVPFTSFFFPCLCCTRHQTFVTVISGAIRFIFIVTTKHWAYPILTTQRVAVAIELITVLNNLEWHQLLRE